MNSENIDILTVLQLLNVRTDSKLVPKMFAKILTNVTIVHAMIQLHALTLKVLLNANVEMVGLLMMLELVAMISMNVTPP